MGRRERPRGGRGSGSALPGRVRSRAPVLWTSLVTTVVERAVAVQAGVLSLTALSPVQLSPPGLKPVVM